jgi:hypothetical protein
MTIAQRLVFVFEWKGAVHSNRRGCQFTQPLEGKVVVYGQAMTCLSFSNSWVTHSIPLFTLSSPFLAHLCAITFRTSYTIATGRSLASVCERLITGIADSNPAESVGFRFLCSFVGSGLCDWLITSSGVLPGVSVLYRVIIKSLCTWWLQYKWLQVMFKLSPASLQTFIDRQGQRNTTLTLTPSVIPNYNCVIMVSDWNCLKYFSVFFYCNHQVHRYFLITLYNTPSLISGI